MDIKEIMTPEVNMLEPGDSLEKAARMMQENDIGSVPIHDGDRLVGIVTDRDIAVRAVAAGKNASTAVEEAMSSPILYCYEDESVEEVGKNMAKNQIRRLPVLNREKRLVGVVALGDLACCQESGHCAEQALRAISQPTID